MKYNFAQITTGVKRTIWGKYAFGKNKHTVHSMVDDIIDILDSGAAGTGRG
jgi:hypothetical protein